MSPSDADMARVVPGSEPVTEVTVHAHMVYGSGLPDPLDIVVLLHLMFMVAGGQSPTITTLLAALRAQGIRNSNGKGGGLIGRDAVQASFRRLVAAGFLRRVQQAHGARGQFGAAAYELYRRPVFNPDWTPSDPLRPIGDSPESSQVTPFTVTPAAVPASNRVSAGRTVDAHTVHGDTAHGHTGHSGGRVSAGRTVDAHTVHGAVHPPHPPEEVTTSSPNPLTTRHAPPPQDDQRFSEEDLVQAERFLQLLPPPWSAGRQLAKRLRQPLLEAATEQGWLLDRQLVQQLTRNPYKINNYARVLEKDRIANLPLYEVVHGSRPSRIGRQQSPAQPADRIDGHCGALECDPVTRTREHRNADGLLTLSPCPECRPQRYRQPQ
ncbi:hypothetical protein [Kitasatospora azatica]|uniref:hypothetical protein n=1 Tax=Kitasatospora azatica TaxID=58347 RepID=UPI00056358F5|nr:hypothetical protein [Kitasatospora azatica]